MSFVAPVGRQRDQNNVSMKQRLFEASTRATVAGIDYSRRPEGNI
jgi:hypothetical protein